MRLRANRFCNGCKVHFAGHIQRQDRSIRPQSHKIARLSRVRVHQLGSRANLHTLFFKRPSNPIQTPFKRGRQHSPIPPYAPRPIRGGAGVNGGENGSAAGVRHPEILQPVAMIRRRRVRPKFATRFKNQTKPQHTRTNPK